MATATYDKQPVNVSAGLLVLFCALLWAGQSVAVKIALEDVTRFQLLFSRTLLSLGIIGLWALATRDSLRIYGEQFGMVGINAVFLFVQLGLYTAGTDQTSSVHSIVIINSFPLYTALFCHFFLAGFELTKGTIAGLVLAFAAVVIVFGDQLLFAPDDQATLSGDLLVAAAAMTMGGKITYLKSIFGRIRPVQVVFWEAIITVPVFLAVSLWLEQPNWNFSAEAGAAIAYQGVAVSGMAFVIWITLLSRHAPNDLTVYRLATPLLGLVLGWMILDEVLTPYLFVGAAMLAVGIWLVNR